MKRNSLLLYGAMFTILSTASAEPVHLDPTNPSYFRWNGKTTAVVTSAEHYGAVLNLDFNYQRYLQTLQQDGMNYTEIFSGSYVEPFGSFGIERNTLGPAQGRFISPWARSNTPGYAGGGNKFDLSRFDPAYLQRLKDFLQQAQQRRVMVELVLFCSTYSDAQWGVSPFNPANNINGTNVTDFKLLHTTDNGNVFSYQSQLVRYLVRELNRFDNLIFEIQNEPYIDNPVTVEAPEQNEIAAEGSQAWQSAIAGIVKEEELLLPNKHLIAQNIANGQLPVRDGDLTPFTSIINFHYATAETATWNPGFKRVLGDDETGYAGTADSTYRRQAWEFMLAGGGLFNNLDYSFSVGREDGSDFQPTSPGGGSVALRHQLKVLSQLLNAMDLSATYPDPLVVKHAPGVAVRALVSPRAYLLYLSGRAPTNLELSLAPGRWQASWINVLDGTITKTEQFTHFVGTKVLASPEFDNEIALRVMKN